MFKNIVVALLVATPIVGCQSASRKVVPAVNAYCAVGESRRVLIREVVAEAIEPHSIEIRCGH